MKKRSMSQKLGITAGPDARPRGYRCLMLGAVVGLVPLLFTDVGLGAWVESTIVVALVLVVAGLLMRRTAAARNSRSGMSMTPDPSGTGRFAPEVAVPRDEAGHDSDRAPADRADLVSAGH